MGIGLLVGVVWGVTKGVCSLYLLFEVPFYVPSSIPVRRGIGCNSPQSRAKKLRLRCRLVFSGVGGVLTGRYFGRWDLWFLGRRENIPSECCVDRLLCVQ